MSAKKTSIYISGKITGEPDYKTKFEEAETRIRAKYPQAEIINPAKNHVDERGLSPQQIWDAYMAISRQQIRRSTLVVYLPCWVRSKGAQEEISLAQKRKITTKSISEI